MLSREQMIEEFLQAFVPEANHMGARIALTLIVQTLERRAELKGSLTSDLTSRAVPPVAHDPIDGRATG